MTMLERFGEIICNDWNETLAKEMENLQKLH